MSLGAKVLRELQVFFVAKWEQIKKLMFFLYRIKMQKKRRICFAKTCVTGSEESWVTRQKRFNGWLQGTGGKMKEVAQIHLWFIPGKAVSLTHYIFHILFVQLFSALSRSYLSQTTTPTWVASPVTLCLTKTNKKKCEKSWFSTKKNDIRNKHVEWNKTQVTVHSQKIKELTAFYK